MKFEEYPLRVPNVKRIEKKIEGFIEDLNNATCKEDAIKVLKKFFKLNDDLSTDFNVIMIRNTIDTRDPVYEKAIEKLDEGMPLITSISNRFVKELLNSKYIDDLKEKFGSHLFNMYKNSLRCFDDAIIEEKVEENKLVTQYQKLMASAKIEYKGETLNLSQLGKYLSSKDKEERYQAAKLYYGFIEEHDKEFGDIYDRLVKLRDQMAKKLGFKNFVELGYLNLGRLDYDASMVKEYRKQIEEVVVPVVSKLRKRQARRNDIKNPNFLDYNVDFKSGNAKPIGNTEFLVSKASEMYHDMSKESGEFFDFMVDNHLMDLDAKEGKSGGGYMTYMPRYKAPFIFSNSNGTSQDVDTLTHEVGHAFQGYLSGAIKVPDYRAPGLEACEVHSMSMEFFAYPYMELFFGDQADKYRFSHLDGAISFLPYGVEVDEFQTWVYEHPEATHDERCAFWRELDKKYRPWIKYGDFKYLDKGTIWIRQSHIFASPFYYIDYTLAQVLALQFKCEMDKNKEKAWKKYLKLLKLGGKYPFRELLEKAHLRNPFIDGNVKKVIKPQEKLLNGIDDTKF